MREPLHLTLYRSDKGEAARVPETPVEAATVRGQAVRRNELAKTGYTEGLLAARPHYWRAQFGRNLILGFVVGVVIASVAALLIPG